MTREIKRLYLFYLLNGLALAVIANGAFLDRLLLRMGLSLAQFGLAKGVATFVPLTVNLLVAPTIARLRLHGKVAGFGYVVRTAVPFLFLALPFLVATTRARALGAAAILLATMTFPGLANNSLSVLQKQHLPAGQLGLHLSRLNIVWYVPPYFLAAACAWLADEAATLPAGPFYRTYLWLYVATGVLQIPACLAIIGVGSDAGADGEAAHAGLGDVLEPFGDEGYRGLLLVSLASGVVSTMFMSFVNPYLMQARGMSTTAITVVDAVVSVGMLLLLPLWGRMTDRFGSRNILYLCTLGIALGALLLAGGGLVLFALSSLLAWRGTQGILASGKGVAGQALLLTKTVREKAGSYVAAASFAGGVGGLLGSLSGGALLEWLAERPQLGQHFDHYRIYFCLVGLAHVLLAGLVFALDDGQPRLSPTSFLRQAFRGARRRIRRGLCRDRMW